MVVLLVSVYSRAGIITGAKDGDIRESSYLINLNEAEKGELTLIPGIGPHLAAKIVSYRQQRGCFRFMSDLNGVKGIGPAKISEISKWAILNKRGDPAEQE